jgi:hypothetical protein
MQPSGYCSRPEVGNRKDSNRPAIRWQETKGGNDSPDYKTRFYFTREAKCLSVI